jgi:hypothetical protein
MENHLMLTHDELNVAIGEVATASGSQDELLRSTMSGLTDVNFSYVLFEGVSGEQLANSLRAILSEFYHYIEYFGKDSKFKYDPSVPYVERPLVSPNYIAVNATLAESKTLRELRNNIIHGTWKRVPYATDAGPRPRPWSDKSVKGEDVFYCNISKLRKMYANQAFTVSDIKELASRIRAVTSRLSASIRLALEELADNGVIEEADPALLRDWP